MKLAPWRTIVPVLCTSLVHNTGTGCREEEAVVENMQRWWPVVAFEYRHWRVLGALAVA